MKKGLTIERRARSLHHYYPRDGFFKRLFTPRRPQIAVIDVVGTIISGRSRRDRTARQAAGAETIGSYLDHARDSRRVRGVLLRVDSPGGSGGASDVMWRKISQVRERKPVVVSFGDVAASGGYYIAVAGSSIFSEGLSITGSIGVLGGKFVMRDLMNRLAIRRESISRGQHAEYASWLKPFSQAEAEKLESHLQEFYREDFVKKVAQGRKMTEEEVDGIGRGRIWSGIRAQNHGLVDRLGGPLEALMETRRLAGIPDKKKIRLVHYHRRRRLLDLFIPDFSAETTAAEILRQLGTSVLLWMPYQFRIR
jgi:protease-4